MNRKQVYRILLVLIAGFLLFLFVPVAKFAAPTSTLVLDQHGELLGARVSSDEQWRFAPLDSVPQKFSTCLLFFEDKHFYQHPGVNPVSLFRALYLNVRFGEIRSGGSTLTMQTVRLSRNKQRTYVQKTAEILMALRLELAKSKKEILNLYSSNAPFGGNIVGLEAASWRYFGRSPYDLTWAESATLAVLPNAPAIIHPGRNRNALLNKRNSLLEKLCDSGKIDQETLELSLLESLPEKPYPLPNIATHLTDKLNATQHGKRITTAVEKTLQENCNAILKRHHNNWKHNHVMNGAILVLDTKSGEVLAYVGNVPDLKPQFASNVNIIDASRSSGSTLKPILMAGMIDQGLITPYSLLPDIPVSYNGFTPRNFDLQYDGAVPANDALVRSLNIPATFMLRDYGILPFYHLLQNFGFSTFTRSADNYGLSLILGGGEISLYELCGVYASMGRSLFDESEPFSAPLLYPNQKVKHMKSPVSKAAIWEVLNMITELNRPQEESGWRYFSSSQKIAWKTGTSFGFRDAWAVGVTPEFTIGVWMGNADGEGRAGLTGVKTAAPILFDVLHSLPTTSTWFSDENIELEAIDICAESGYRTGPDCEHSISKRLPSSCLKTKICPYHKRVHLNKAETEQVNSTCYPVYDIVTKNWFQLPPVMEWYYKQNHPQYRQLPPWNADCNPNPESGRLSFILPNSIDRVFIPRDFGGEKSGIVVEVTGSYANEKLYWHMDGVFLGSTTQHHQMVLHPRAGQHSLSVVGENGDKLQKSITVKE